jgi:hypothetical protein
MHGQRVRSTKVAQRLEMAHVSQGYNRLSENLVSWAQAQDDIGAAILIGSRARSDHPADEWSDLDVLLGVFQHAKTRGIIR